MQLNNALLVNRTLLFLLVLYLNYIRLKRLTINIKFVNDNTLTDSCHTVFGK